VDLAALVPWYLDAVMLPPDDRYQLSLWGWLESKHGKSVLDIVDKTLGFFRARYQTDDYRPFSWEELKHADVARDDSRLYLVQVILGDLRWLKGGSTSGWGLPSGTELEHLVNYRDASECLAQVQLERVRLHYHDAAFRAHMAGLAMATPWRTPPEDDMLADFAAILDGRPLHINFGGSVTTFNNQNSTVGAQGAGDHSPVTGTVNVTTTATQTWTSQAQYTDTIKAARKALVDDEDALGPALYQVLGEIFRRLQAIQVEQVAQAEVLAKVKETVDEVFAMHKAEELRPKLLPEGLRFAEALSKSPLLAVLLTVLTGKK
jgi:hypothetical protein